MHLVLAASDPVAIRFVHRMVQKGESVAVVAGHEQAREFPDGVTVFRGDPTSIDFGLPGPTYRQLLEQVKKIHLPQGEMSTVGEVEGSRPVRRAAELREFVRAGGAPDGVVYLSSLLVFGNARGPVREDELQVGQRFQDEFEESLAIAERIVQSISDSRVVSILRTAPIAGDEGSGTLISGAPLSRLVAAIGRIGRDKGLSFTDLPLRWDTVDRVSEALLSIVDDETGRVYHLVDEDPLSDRQVVLWLAERFEKTILDSPAGTRSWSGWGRAPFPGSRSVAGWGLHFLRQNAEQRLGHLLDWDQAAVLSRLVPREGTADG